MPESAELLGKEMAADTIIGGTEDNVHFVDDNGDTIKDQGGFDTVQTTLNFYTLQAPVMTSEYISGAPPYYTGSTVTYDNRLEQLEFVGVGNFQGTGNSLDNTIIGGSGDDTLDGGSGADNLVGGAGNDRLIGYSPMDLSSAGADTLTGGVGDDTYVVDSRDIVREDSNGGTDTVELSAMAGGPNPSNPNGLWVYDSSYTLGHNLENLTFKGTMYGPNGVSLIGNSLNNVITNEATYGSVTLDGGVGADTLMGGNGSDTYIVDDVGDHVVEVASEGYGYLDTVRTSLPTYTLTDNVENLVYTGTNSFHGIGNAAANEITGGDGNDTLDGGINSGYEYRGDHLIGGKGDDLYRLDVSGHGFITEKSNEGTDTVEYYSEGWGQDHVIGDNVENARFVGTGEISITGNDLNNTLTTSDGNDALDGGSGSDTLIGGSGDDTYYVDNASDVVIETTNGGYDTVVSTLSYYALGANVEALRLGGDEFGNDIDQDGDGNNLDNAIEGNFGNNVIKGFGGNDYIRGNGGADLLDGGDGDDSIWAGSGNATILGGAGADTIYVGEGVATVDGGTGDDTIWSSGGNDRITAGEGKDTVYAGAGDDSVSGDDGDDWLYGEFGHDNLVGGFGNDALIGASGNDTLVGGADNDTLDGGVGNDSLDGGAGFDYVNFFGTRTDFAITKNQDGTITIKDTWTFDGDEGTDIISGVEAFHFRDGIITLEDLMKMPDGPIQLPQGPQGEPGSQGPQGETGPTGPKGPVVTVPVAAPGIAGQTTPGSDTIIGTDASEKLYGWDGNDHIIGGGGDDLIFGGTGKDTLTGDAGRDAFVFDTKPNKTSNIDRITDFNVADDSIYLENAIFKALGKSGSASKPALLKSSYFYAGTKAHDANDHIIYNKKTGALYYDADGTGSQAQVQIATLSKDLKLTYKDFYVI